MLSVQAVFHFLCYNCVGGGGGGRGGGGGSFLLMHKKISVTVLQLFFIALPFL